MINQLLMAPLQRAKGQSQIQEMQRGGARMAYICDHGCIVCSVIELSLRQNHHFYQHFTYIYSVYILSCIKEK